MNGPHPERRADLMRTLRRPIGDLPHQLALQPLDHPFDVRLRPPGSKSLTNRALLLAGLAAGESCLRRPLLDADDTQCMIAALTDLGVRFDIQSDALLVDGVGGRWDQPEPGDSLTLDLHNAGTATRFLTAAAVLADPASQGIVIDGNARMRQRPIAELAALLRVLGAHVEFLGEDGFVPLRILPPSDLGSLRPDLAVPTTLSSQFVSALMLTAPFLPGGLTIHFAGRITSQSYIEMTLALLRTVGVRAVGELDGPSGSWVRILPARFEQLGHNEHPAIDDADCLLDPFDLEIEPDASSATYFWAAAALLHDARCTIDGIDGASLQGDARFVRLLERMGAHVGIDENGDRSTTVRGAGPLASIAADMSRMPDAALTLAVVCCFAHGTSTLTGLGTLRVKETDRLAALRDELGKIGVRVDVIESGNGEEGLRITPPRPGIDRSADAPPITFDTYDDHRMAMSLALVGLLRPNVTINDPVCVAKTYPTFWRDLATLYI